MPAQTTSSLLRSSSCTGRSDAWPDTNLNTVLVAQAGLLLLEERPSSCRLSGPEAWHRRGSIKSVDKSKLTACCILTPADEHSQQCDNQSDMGFTRLFMLTYATRFSELGSHWSKKSSASAVRRDCSQNASVAKISTGRIPTQYGQTQLTYHLSRLVASRSAFGQSLCIYLQGFWAEPCTEVRTVDKCCYRQKL